MFQLRHNSYCMLETGNRPVCSKSHCILSFHFYNNILIDRKNIVVEMSLYYHLSLYLFLSLCLSKCLTIPLMKPISNIKDIRMCISYLY